jgi:hypothetical protein
VKFKAALADRGVAEEAAALLRRNAKGRWRVIEPSEETFWRAHQRLLDELSMSTTRFPGLRVLKEQDVVLGFLGASH